MHLIKKYSSIAFLFLFFFICLVFIFTLSRGDTFVNYGFSYAISKGEIPYKDFNMVITPFAPFLYSFGLFFCKNILVYYLEQALLLTVLFSFLKKMLNNKIILFLLFLILPYPVAIVSVIFPGYNFLLCFLFFLFVFSFKENKNPYFLGFLLGLIFCTKQTIGLVLFLPTFYYLLKDSKKFFSMVVGFSVPIFILFLYLFLSGSFSSFINLCFLGLFDFQSNNSQIDWFYFILFLLGVLFFIISILKNPKNILLYYGLLFGFVVFPIIDYYHVSLFLIVVFYFFLDKISIDKRLISLSYVFIVLICIIWSFVSYQFFGDPVLSNFSNFSFLINKRSYVDSTQSLLDYVDSLDGRVIYFMRGSENYYFKIIQNQKLDYFDLPNYGNYGYDGIKMMKVKIDSVHNAYFVLDEALMVDHNINQQYIKELGNYAIQCSDKIDDIGIYGIYYKE